MNPVELKIARLRRKMSGRELAEQLNITVDGYLKKEHGNARVTLYEARVISNSLRLSFKEFSSIFFDEKLRFSKPDKESNDFSTAEFPLREARRIAGFSEGQVARELGLTQPAYKAREMGKVRVTLEQCRVLTEMFKLNFAEFNEIFFNSCLQIDNFNDLVDFIVI